MMPTRLDLTELNKLFDKPSPTPPSHRAHTTEDRAWLEQFFARVHFIESLNAKQLYTNEGSPSSSSTTLVDEDDDLLDVFRISKVEEPFFSVADVHTDIQMYSIMDDHPDNLVQEFYRLGRTEHRKALSLDTDMFSYRSTPSPSPSSSISSSSFNPNAEPFVPTLTPPVQSTTPSLSSEHVPWFPIFWTGVSTDDPETHRLYAAALVDSIQWTIEALAVLSQHFCWKGADDATESGSGVAPFARAVHDQLREIYGDWYANCLTRHIRELVVGHFKGCWKSVSSSRFITPSS